MVNIIENRALVTGTVKTISSEPDARGFYLITLELLNTEDLDSLPNLARADEGKDISIRMQQDKINENQLKPCTEISLAIRKAFGQVYFAQD